MYPILGHYLTKGARCDKMRGNGRANVRPPNSTSPWEASWN